MRDLVLVGAIVLAAAGCGKKPDPFEDVLSRLEAFKIRMCACKDAACAEDVRGQWKAYRKATVEKLDGARPVGAQDKQGRELSEAMSRCFARITEAEELAAEAGAEAPAAEEGAQDAPAPDATSTP